VSDDRRTTDDTLQTVDGRQSLRFERHLTHPVERVWSAVSVPAELALWFPAAADWTPAAGETFGAHGVTGEVTEVDRPRLLAWTFAGEHYRFELSERDGGCLLVFVHVFDGRPRAAQTAAGWNAYLSRLAPHLDGGHRTEEEAHASWERVHEEYAERFGVDPAPGRAFIASSRAD
jgi:uncharacterized protein YndB with AHSA1/START domain